MREIINHTPGRVFLLILVLSLLGLIYVIRYFGKPVLVFGWITLPYLAGIVFVVIWCIAYLIYFFKFWPYR